PDPARLRDDVELLVVGAVEAGDLAAEQVDVEGLQRGVRRQQAERLVDPLVRRDDRVRVVLRERVGDELLDAGVVEDRRIYRRLRLELAERDHLVLDRPVDLGGVLGRLGRRRATDRGRGYGRRR